MEVKQDNIMCARGGIFIVLGSDMCEIILGSMIPFQPTALLHSSMYYY